MWSVDSPSRVGKELAKGRGWQKRRVGVSAWAR